MKNLGKYGVFAAFAVFVVIVAVVWASSSSENNTARSSTEATSAEEVVSPKVEGASSTVESFKKAAEAPTKLEGSQAEEAAAISTTEANAEGNTNASAPEKDSPENIEEGTVLPPLVITPRSAEEKSSGATAQPAPTR
jgi:hypothetical protein